MTPAQVDLAVRLAVIAGALAAAFVGGWWVNGWRLGEANANLERARDAAIAQGKVLAEGLATCNASVDAAKAAGAAAIKQGQQLIAEARRLGKPGLDQAAKAEAALARGTPAGAGCEDAWREIHANRMAGAGK